MWQLDLKRNEKKTVIRADGFTTHQAHLAFLTLIPPKWFERGKRWLGDIQIPCVPEIVAFKYKNMKLIFFVDFFGSVS